MMIVSEERNKLEVRKTRLNKRQELCDQKLDSINGFTRGVSVLATNKSQKKSLEREVNNLSHLIRMTRDQVTYYTNVLGEAEFLLADYELNNLQFEKFKQHVEDLENRALNAIKIMEVPIIPQHESEEEIAEEEEEENEENHTTYTISDLDVVNEYLELEIYREMELDEKIRKENLERKTNLFIRGQNIRNVNHQHTRRVEEKKAHLRSLIKNDPEEEKEHQMLCEAYQILNRKREEINIVNRSLRKLEKDIKEIRRSVEIEYNNKLEKIRYLTDKFKDQAKILAELDRIERENDNLHERINNLYFRKLKYELIDDSIPQRRGIALRRRSENHVHNSKLQKSIKYVEDLNISIRSRRSSIQTLKEHISSMEIELNTSGTRYQDILERVKAASDTTEESIIISSIVE